MHSTTSTTGAVVHGSVLAESTGKRCAKSTEAMAVQVSKQIGGERQQSSLHFEALKRLLDRDEPGWSKPDEPSF